MSLNDSCEKYFRLKYTSLILTNDSELEKEEKIKCYFSLLFDFWKNG